MSWRLHHELDWVVVDDDDLLPPLTVATVHGDGSAAPLIAAAPEMRAILDDFMRGIQPQGDDGRVRVDGAFLLGVREKIAALLARIDGTPLSGPDAD